MLDRATTASDAYSKGETYSRNQPATQRFTAFHAIQDAFERLSQLDNRANQLALRLTGPYPEEASQPKEPETPPGVFGDLAKIARDMTVRIGRINNALDAIEQQLP